ncbi:IucA/IucC family protein [Haloarcula rubripromontorii]|uniref:Iron transporter n=1 Tax=Haloarcula rubripromontorii TaxID=1705562 RepID=A0A0N0BNF6_9EURY|nr:IucA/IucC family siderophore biosynthesis protein [Haloarcula rubripromontorii]KOX92436.1 iron transporter [Haloarcula rubripromontorii]
MENYERLQSVMRSGHWKTANSEMLRRVLREFMRESILTPTQIGTVQATESEPSDSWGRYVVGVDDGVEYRFDANPRPFSCYRIRVGSTYRRKDNEEWTEATDPLQFILDARHLIGIDSVTTGHLLREFYNTLVADTHIRAQKADREDESILDLPFAAVDGEMEGHPKYTYNKGRMGFDYDDYLAYVPESKQRQTLSWLAVRNDRATFKSVEGVTAEDLLTTELGEQYQQFKTVVSEQGYEPDNYHFMPVHDWQWNDSIAQLFAGEIASGALIPLGKGPNEYLPQQSIRTFTNLTDPTKHQVKLPLKIRNTNVYRGILGEQAMAAPDVTEVIKSIRDDDPYLRDELDLVLPGEIASVNYQHPKYSQLDDAPYQYHELLACIWRESAVAPVREKESSLLLAAVIHEDFDGTPVVSKLAERSGRDIETWLDKFFEVFLFPILHYLYKYGLVFMPHGTNVSLIHEEGEPKRIAITDFVDEVALVDRDFPELIEKLPQKFQDGDQFKHYILKRKPPVLLTHRIVGTVLDGIGRFVSDLLARNHGYPESRFWQQLHRAIQKYHDRFPEYEDRFDLFDLYRPRFRNYCLNRNRMLDNGYEDSSTRPKVQYHGTLENPLHRFD